MNIAIIPLRAGSTGLPGKNTRLMHGKPLYRWSIDQAKASRCFGEIVVATDDPAVTDELVKPALLFERHPMTATATASTESVLLEVLLEYQPEQACLLQATSPLRRTEDIQEVMKKLAFRKAGVSVVRDHRVFPTETRVRRQDSARFVENGSIYAFHTSAFMETMDRRVDGAALYEMPLWTRHEIDDEDDWDIVYEMMDRYGLIEEQRIPLVPRTQSMPTATEPEGSP